MKKSSGHLVFAVLGLALVCAVGAFFLLRGSTTVTEGIAGSAEEQNPPVASLTTNNPPQSRPQRAAIAPRREEVSSGGATIDPEYQAALAGFRGRVVTAESKPAPDKLVKLYRFDPSIVMLPGVTSSGDTLIEPNLDAGEARTGSDGTFTISGVYPGSTYALVADSGGEVPTFRILERSPGPGLVVDLGDIPLRTTATVTGTVVAADGKPIAGALVRALDLPGAALAAMPVERFDPEGAVLMRTLPGGRPGGKVVFEIPAWVKRRFDELPIPKARSDVDGKFVLRGVDPGVNAFMVTSANLTSFVNPTLRLKAGQTKDVGTIKLEPGETVQGRVIDGNGTAVVGAEILVAQTSPAVPVDLALRAPKTDEKGRFACAGLKPGMATVAARRSAREPWTITEPAAIGGDLVVKLPTVATLTVKLVSKAGRAIEKPRLKLYPSSADEPWALLGFIAPLDLGDRLDLQAGGVLEIKDLAVGEYRLVADCTEHATGQVLVTLSADQELRLELEGQQSVRVLVFDPRGNPLRGAAIHHAARNVKGRSVAMAIHAGVTAVDGHLDVVVPADTKELMLTASHPRYAQAHLTLAPLSLEARMTLGETGAITCLVTTNGKPAEPGKFHVAVMRSWKDSGGRGALPSMGRLGLPDVNGMFTMTGLAPGTYMLDASASVADVSSPGKFFSNVFRMSSTGQSTECVVAAGQTTNVTLDTDLQAPVQGPAARVFGTAFVDGRPAVGMKVRCWGSRSLAVTVDAAGRFDFNRVGVGQVLLALTDGDQSQGSSRLWGSTFQLEAEKDREIKIDVQTMKIIGRVVGFDGLPVEGAMVRGDWNSRSERPDAPSEYTQFEAVSGSDGTFEASNVRSADYAIRAEKQGVGKSESVLLTASASSAPIELRLLRMSAFGGRIDLVASGIPVRDGIWHISFRPVPTMKPAVKSAKSVITSATFRSDGKFKVGAIAPGTYRVRAWVGEFEYEGSAEVIVTDVAVSDAVLVLRRKPDEQNQNRK